MRKIAIILICVLFLAGCKTAEEPAEAQEQQTLEISEADPIQEIYTQTEGIYYVLKLRPIEETAIYQKCAEFHNGVSRFAETIVFTDFKNTLPEKTCFVLKALYGNNQERKRGTSCLEPNEEASFSLDIDGCHKQVKLEILREDDEKVITTVNFGS